MDAWKKIRPANPEVSKNIGALEALNAPKGSRPDPRTYLGNDYVAKHLAKFEDGVSCLKLESVKRYPNLGMDDGLFVLPKAEMDKVLQKTGGDISLIEKELGIPAKGGWGEHIEKGDKLIRIDIDKSQMTNLRIPHGNESTANELWLPGGKNSGGYSEAIIDAVSWEKIKNEQLKIIIEK